MVVLTGEEPFWRAEVLREIRELSGGEATQSSSGFRRLEGNLLSWADLVAELDTPSLFGGRKVVAVEEADSFVGRHQKELLQLGENPAEWGVLLLNLRSLAANSRLGRLVVQRHLWIDCSSAPSNQLFQWLPAWAHARYGLRLSQAAAKAVLDAVGENPGLLDQQLRKLTLEVGATRTVTLQQVRRFCEEWRVKHAWAILDLAMEGKPGEALRELDRLLTSGEHPLAILAQLGGTLRRVSHAASLIDKNNNASQPSVARVLSQLGAPPSIASKTLAQLRHLGVRNARLLSQVLLSADFQLKGGSTLDARVVLEKLILWLADPGVRKLPFQSAELQAELPI